MNTELVVAHYREDIAWLDQVPAGVTVIVYEKFAYSKTRTYGAYFLPNVGRDVHTHITHMSLRYDCLADVTFFVQGHPFDRSRFTTSLLGGTVPAPYMEYGTDVYYEQAQNAVMERAWRLVFNEPWRPATSYLCCLFHATRAAIQANDRPFYRRLQSYLERGAEDIAAESWPYIIERMWWRIFHALPPVKWEMSAAGLTIRL